MLGGHLNRGSVKAHGGYAEDGVQQKPWLGEEKGGEEETLVVAVAIE